MRPIFNLQFSKSQFKKILCSILILNLIFSSFPFNSFAQTATDSSLLNQASSSAQTNNTATASSSLNSSSFNDGFLDVSLVPTNNTPSYLSSLVFPSFDTGLPGSANLTTNQNKKWAVALNTKHDFKGDETYQVNINDISPQNLNAEVFDANGKAVSVNFNKIATVNGTSIQILPPKNFKPGKYTLKLTDSSGNVTTQDFTWGVLAINTNKSIYLSSEALAKEGLPPETANLAMAVLDDKGAMVCDALLRLEIKAPDGQATILSTDNGLIKVNPECQVHDYTEKPDYQASYQTSTAGTYNMTLTASIANGVRTITDSFQVQNSVLFDVERQTGTRIFPPATYPVNFNIKANQDFKGQIIEYVPNSFTIYSSTNSAAPVFDVKQIATPIKSANGTYSSINLSLPFSGTRMETLGFGDKLLDPQEKDLYAQFGLLGHDGLDFEMPIGTPVYSVDGGTVVMAGGQIYGTTVVIQHSWGRSYYGHLSKVNVALGQTITKGQEIALSGNTGITTGPHLHFSIKLNANDPANGFYGKTDPSLYLGIQSQPQITAANINDTVKAIVWDIDAKNGETLNLSYAFVAPSVSPQFYTLGPLSFVENNNQVVFQEARVWQIAADATTETFTTSTTWTAPTGVTSVTAEVWGGGGGGGGQNLASDGGGGGGGGAYSKQTAITVVPGNSYTVTVGSGGTGGTSGCGTTGGDSWFVNTSTVLAKGGVGGCNSTGTPPAGGLGGAAASGVGGTKFDGGQGEKGKDNANGVGGYGGSSAGTAAGGFSGPQTWSTEIYPTASTPTGGGDGGDGGAKSANGVAPVSGNGGGGGGSGEGTAMTGGAGAVGKVILTYNKPPNAPTQNSPTQSATDVSVTPTFLMTATDADTAVDNLSYKVTIYSNSGCTAVVQTNDQAVSSTGWTGTNATCTAAPTACYTSGTQGSFLTQTALSELTQYWWKASAKDPDGNGSFTDSSTCNSFTTGSAGPTLDQLMRHGAWFSNGAEQPFTF